MGLWALNQNYHRARALAGRSPEPLTPRISEMEERKGDIISSNPCVMPRPPPYLRDEGFGLNTSRNEKLMSC